MTAIDRGDNANDIARDWQAQLDAAAWRNRAAASTRERDELQEALRQADEARRAAEQAAAALREAQYEDADAAWHDAVAWRAVALASLLCVVLLVLAAAATWALAVVGG